MPYLENDRVTVTDPTSAYYGKFGTVVWYWSGLECPAVDVKLDPLFGTATFNETAIALGEHKMKALPQYEYNLMVDGKIFYTVWGPLKELTDLWNTEEDVEELKERLHRLFAASTLVRRLKAGEIEEI